MKLRLKGNTLRLRLDQDDLTRFAEEGQVEAVTRFGGDSAFRYTLQAATEIEALTAEAKPGQVVVHIPLDLAEAWTQTDRVTLEAEQSVGEGERLQILVEKDLGCQHREAGAADTFDHLRNPAQPLRR